MAGYGVRAQRHLLERDGRAVLPIGSHFVPPSGPDWPWRVGVAEFETAFAAMASAGLDTVRIDLIWSAIEPQQGQFDEEHLRVLDGVFDAAAVHGLTVHPTLFVGGEVGDAYWDLPWAVGRNPHTDHELIEAQRNHARKLAYRWCDRENLIAWDLTDEPPFWLYAGSTTDEDARVWTAAIVGAIRDADPHRLITIGTASQEIGGGPFRADVVAPLLDFASVHPYPIYSPQFYPDRLLSMRMTLGAAFEVALASGAGRPVMMHEYGASSTQFSEEHIAAYDRLSTWAALGAGSAGFYSWCWTDAEPEAFRRVPYVRSPHETQFGMTRFDGRPRARLVTMSAMSTILSRLDLEGRMSSGPVKSASMPVPHETVRPYDEKWYGLTEGESGLYSPSEQVWRPDRDLVPLIRGALNAYVLAARAGVSLDFPRERIDGEWPDAKLVISAAPLTSTSNSLIHLRTLTLAGRKALHDEGRVLYLSCSSETAIPDLAAFAGVTIVDRARFTDVVEYRFVQGFGDIAAGEVLTFRSGSSEPGHRGAELLIVDAEVVAVDAAGAPVLTVARVGAGRTVVSAHPIELLLSTVPDAHGVSDESWRLYRALAIEAGALPNARVDHADVSSWQLTGPEGGVLICVNHSINEIEAVVVLPGDADPTTVEILLADSSTGSVESGRVRLSGHASCVITWAGAGR